MGHTRHRTAEKILETASELFFSHTYGATSVDEIAKNAGVTKVTVYQHYGSKEKLFMECLQMRLKRREAELDRFFRELGAEKDPLIAIFDWLENWVNPQNFRGCSFVKAVNELAAVMPQVKAVAFEAKQKIQQRLAAMAKDTGRPHPVQLGQDLALVFEGAQSLALIEGSARPAQAARRIAARLLTADEKGNAAAKVSALSSAH